MSLRLIKSPSSVGDNNILKNLNSPQSEAVTTLKGPLLVIAGAGSGKTRVLTYRIAYLISQGISPYNILALTFTNKAANEMRNRIGQLVSDEKASMIWAGTFHSIFAKILRIEAKHLGFNSNFSIYDTEDSLRTIKGIMVSQGLSQQDYPPQGMQWRISRAKNQMISSMEFNRNAQTSLEKQSGFIYERYEKALFDNNAMDFDDLLLNMIALIKNNKDILNKYRDKFRYILVDEYQDTNKAQYEVVNLLAAEHKNLCVVGDDAQSIYKWRGADIRNILLFQKDYDNAKVIRLEQNYRSTKTILAAADAVIKNNTNQLSKKLWTDNPAGDLIEVKEANDDRYEADYISDTIKNRLFKDFSKKDIAVLYRTNAQSLVLENAFRRNQIPYVVVGGMSFYKRKEIKDTLAYLKLLINPSDGESLIRIINEPPRGLGNVSISHIQNHAGLNRLSLFEAFGQAEMIPELLPKMKKSAHGFYEFINKYRDMLGSVSLGELVLGYIDNSGYPDLYKQMNTEESLDRWNNIQQLLSEITRFARESPSSGLEEFLQQISLVADIDIADTSSDKVSLMTLHSAKGLEFPVVFISGLENGLFPLSRADMTKDDEEEERRLFYVGITRARERLFLTLASERFKFGEKVIQRPSKFLREIKPELMKFSGDFQDVYENSKTVSKPSNLPTKPSFSSMSSSPQKSKLNQNDTLALYDFRVGDIVKHNTFGKGRITGLSGDGDKKQAVVYFASLGAKKQLMLKYANLVLVPPMDSK